ncbi:MAG: 3-phosphoshikimate 1-carboxyvinyltransferase [Bacteroidetes bacterium]|nr:3-phosphoshikimate 1-carboxyvinyltransferase [Bacteroidota bacterium]
MNLTISHPKKKIRGEIKLPSSKSESNRLLILQALSGGELQVENLSDSVDTKLLMEGLASNELNINVGDAGTAMRFLTAYFCVKGKYKIISGSERMHERPIGILVDALREIGFRIEYKGKEGFPPLEIIPVDLSATKKEVHVAGNISSQYVTALLMIAPMLPHGLKINFTTQLVSQPYIHLTLDVLLKSGISYIEGSESIRIAHQRFAPVTLISSMDWSAASYWYAMAALADISDIHLRGLTLGAAQGDKRMADWAANLGVETMTSGPGILLSRSQVTENCCTFDFTNQPDLAQTIIVICAARNIKAKFTGMASLRIKETDRIAALQNELEKFGVRLVESEPETFTFEGTFVMSHQTIKTYNDHRMAMAFAPLALLGPITIEDSEVVAKSYPGFWNEMKKVGFEIRESA